MTDPKTTPIAIVSMSCLFPGSSDLAGFFQDVLAGRDRLTRVPADRWLVEDYFDPDPAAPGKIYVDRGGFLDAVDFDPMRWGVPPSIVPATDSTQLLALVVAERVLRDAFGADAFDDGGYDRDATSVILGVTGAQKLLGEMNSRLQRPVWVKALREMGLPEAQVQEACAKIADSYVTWQESTFPGVLGNVVAGRIANRLDLGGTNCVTDAACASAFAALKMAVDELTLGHSNVVVCGGADTMNDPFMFECFAKTTALSKTGDCRPFSDQADGTMLGEGVGMVVLMRLEDAERLGRPVVAVIRGVGSSSDGRAKSVYAPLPEGQAKALRRAYERAGYGPDTVELVEAHGTGTAAGDAAELEALTTVFRESGRGDPRWCAVGSVKSQIGHTKAAAGAAGLIKAALALRHGVLPPTIKIERPNPAVDWTGGPFYASTEARPWIRGDGHPRRASVSSFGFGGSNFHVALEEYRGPQRAPRVAMGGPELVALSAADAATLAQKVKALASGGLDVSGKSDAKGGAGDSLRWLAWSSQRSFEPTADARLAVVAKDAEDLRGKLALALPFVERGEAFSAPGGVELSFGAASVGPVAFLFPGQGSQYLGMGAPLAMRFERARAAWDRAEEIARVVFAAPSFDPEERAAQEAALRATENAQPALGVASVAMLEVLRALGVTPAMAGGHSFGEAVALYAAGASSEADLLRVARRRGELMAEAAGSAAGAMLAVSAPIDEVRAFVERSGVEVSVANHNHPTQVVLSGAADAIDAAERGLREERVRATRLDVSTAFHSPLVSGSTAPFAAFLEDVPFGPAALPVYANATAAPYEGDARHTLARQIAEPVRFVEQIEAMYAAGARTFVEVGAGSVLSGLVGRILAGRAHSAVALDRKGAADRSAFYGGLAKLAAAGMELRFDALWEDESEPVDPRAAVAPRMTLKLTGANYGKPYPPAEGAAALPGPNEAASSLPRAHGSSEALPAAQASAAPSRSAQASPAPSPHAAPAGSPSPQTAPAGGSESHASDDASLAAFLEMQRQTADAHAAYQRAMADAHTAFLRSAESAMDAMAALAGRGAGDARGSAVAAASQPESRSARPMSEAVAREPEEESRAVRSPELDPAALGRTRTVAETPDGLGGSVGGERSSAPLPPAPAREREGEPDLSALMLEVVSQKTGYPVEMLEPSMELEADLGVDSIKRVEILSALRERSPGLPELDPAALGKLRTLAEIAEVLGGSVAADPAPASLDPAPSRDDDLSALMLEVVSQKTGYPVEMLEPSMELEADLGVDSIKRVEILSALRERSPGLPELDPAALGKLRTLAEIAEVLGGSAGGDPSPASLLPAPAREREGEPDLSALMLEVVSQKTGYPVEMLEPSMELEADLGVDSIKRVEILSALRERSPGLPELDPAALGKLRTLAEIAEVLGGSAGGDPSPASLRPAPARAREQDSSASRARDGGSPGRATRSVVESIDAPAPGLAPPGLFGADVVILDGGSGIGAALVDALGARGVRARTADAAPADADAVVALHGLGPDGRDAARGAFDAARAIAARFTDRGGLFVTVQDTGGDFGSARPWHAGLSGLAKTAALEWPLATVRAIDITGDDLARRLAVEIVDGGIAKEIAVGADGRRRAPRVVPAPDTASTTELADDPVVVASGGARGVTAECLIALAREKGGHYLLLGRTPLTDEPAATRGVADDALERALMEEAKARGEAIAPRELRASARAVRAGREIRATLEALRAAGAQAVYESVDVRDASALGAVLDRFRAARGPITALVHGAGVLADRLLVDKTPEDFERVFTTKVDGLRALLDATADDPRALVLFSSVAARYGNPGQSDYAMANAVLDAVAVHRSCAGERAVSIAWGPWDGGMVTPELAAHFASRGIPLVGLDEGAAAFVREVRTGADPRVVVGAPLAARADGEHRFDVEISRATHPYLVDHAVEDVPVLPVVLVLDLFARAASSLRPDLSLARCRELTVLRGVPLRRFDAGERFEIALSLVSNGHAATYRAELRADGAVRYRAEVDLLPEPLPAAAARPAPALSERAGPLYGGCLFHGARFQVIRRLEGVGEDGAAAALVGTTAVGWLGGGWAIDPALLDGGLQLAVLWTERRLGGAALPTGIAALHVHVPGPIDGEVRAVVRGREAKGGRALCDVCFADDTGRVVAELLGVETHVRPGAATDLEVGR